MYTRYYDGYTQRNTPNPPKEVKENPPPEENIVEIEPALVSEPQSEVASVLPFKLPGNLKTDDLILLAVLFLIASESNDDFILPLILGYLLISNT